MTTGGTWKSNPSFPFDWIEPGEYRYCGCGVILLPPGMLICPKCRYRPKLEDHLCYCGKVASMFFVHGFRCEEHAFQKEPSEATITDKMTITFGRTKPNPNREKQLAEMKVSEEIHRKLEAERNELADNRRKDGIKPLFWMDK